MLIPADDQEPRTPPETLATELHGLTKDGVTIAGLRSCPGILGLAMVAARSLTARSDDLAVSARSLIAEAASRVDGVRRGAALVMLGLAPGTQGTLLKQRRKQAADQLYLNSVDHFRTKRESPLITAVADELYALDTTFRLRHRHRQAGERPPQHSRLGIDWLAQHRIYRRIWTPVAGMRADLNVLLGQLRELRDQGLAIGHEPTEMQQAIADRLCSLSWFFARFQLQMERFIEEQGGLWLLSDPEAEIAVASAAYRLGLHTPFGEADASWLRVQLLESAHEELDPFVDRLVAAGEIRNEFMAEWIDWAGEYAEASKDAAASTECGRWQQAADEYLRLIDEDWLKVADWY